MRARTCAHARVAPDWLARFRGATQVPNLQIGPSDCNGQEPGLLHTLIVSEKDIAAKRIAQILSDGKSKRVVVNHTATYEWTKEGKKFTVIGLSGHIVELDFPKKFKRWFSIAPIKLIDIEPEKRPEPKGKALAIVGALKKMAPNYERALIATDYDREGELIGVEALDILKGENKKLTFKRAQFSSLTPKEVKTAFESPTAIDYQLAKSGQSRQVVDLVWGVVLTRFLSMTSGQVGMDFLSVGRVQSPTLAIIVDREKQIDAFKPKAYWVVSAEVEGDGRFEAEHGHGRFFNEREAKSALAKAQTANHALVTSVSAKTRTDKPVPPFNTTSFLQAAGRIGVLANAAMNIAESLYMRGFISYPRTDNTVYPPSLGIGEILDNLKKSEFAPLIDEILEQETIVPVKGPKTATDHPPVHPVEAAQRAALKPDEWKIYELVVRRFLATLAPEAKTETLTVKLDIGGEVFQAKGTRIVEAGWRHYYPYLEIKETILPKVKEGDKLKVIRVWDERKETLPPPRWSQGALITEMERLGLGTKATRHTIIQKLYDREYIIANPAVPTEVGKIVIEALERHAELITQSEMTAKLEADMELVATGERTFEEVTSESKEMLRKVMEQLEEKKKEIGDEIKVAIRRHNTIGKCPRDGGDIIIKTSRARKRFAGCLNYPNCEQSYPLPQYGRIEAMGEVCQRCASPMVRVFSKGRRPWEVCVNLQCPARLERLAAQEKEKAEAAERGKALAAIAVERGDLPADVLKQQKAREKAAEAEEEEVPAAGAVRTTAPARKARAATKAAAKPAPKPKKIQAVAETMANPPRKRTPAKAKAEGANEK
jgi:DNA topoisomerase-1